MKHVVLSVFLLMQLIIFLPCARGQYYDAGHSPPSVQWRMISTERFDLLFADTMERRAQQMAAYLDTLLPLLQGQYSRPLRRLPIVLHNEVTSPNAFVGWAPSRMEFYTMPPANSDAHDWLEQLAIHESIHWFQFSQMYQGPSGWLAAAFGEHMAAGVMGLFIPYWLIEGDAVYQETALSGAGRGRDAQFETLLRAKMVTSRPYSISKAVLGSYRDRTPGPYETGYQLAAFGREQHGALLWDSLYRYVARNFWQVTPSYWGLRKYTGKGSWRFYREAMEELSNHWREIDTTVYWDTVPRVIATAGRWGELLRPQPFMHGNILAERYHPGKLNAVVSVDYEGKERVLFYPGHTLNNPVSYQNGRVLYTAWSKHPRWPNVQYADLWVYDFGQDTLMRLTHKGRYGGAVEDPIAGEIYTMRYRPDHRHELVRMTGDGEEVAVVALPTGYHPSEPGWWPDQDLMLFVAVTPYGKALYTWNGTDAPVQVSPFTHAHIGQPTGWKHGVLLHAPHHGINQVFLFVPEQNSMLRITQSRFGARFPGVDSNGDLLFSETREQGVAISALPQDQWLMDTLPWPEQTMGFRFADRMPDHYMNIPPLSVMCDSCYHAEKYTPARNLFRFHSWAPADISPDETSIQPGISIMSQNTLSTAFMRAGFRYDLHTLDRSYYATFTLKKWWPEINLEYDFSEVMYYTDTDSHINDFRYGRHTAGLSVSLPLSTTRRQWNRYFNLETSARLLSLVHLSETYEGYPKGELVYGYARLYVHLLRRMAQRDLFPKWGQAFSIVAMGSTAGSLDAGEVIAARWISYWPGVLRNHGLRVYVAAQHRHTGADFNFNRLINTPLGYHDVTIDRAATLQATYKMPLLYPDLPIGPIIYLKRVTVAGFYGHLIRQHDNQQQTLYSYGMEAETDFHLMRHFAPISLGVGRAFRDDGVTHDYIRLNIHL